MILKLIKFYYILLFVLITFILPIITLFKYKPVDCDNFAEGTCYGFKKNGRVTAKYHLNYTRFLCNECFKKIKNYEIDLKKYFLIIGDRYYPINIWERQICSRIVYGKKYVRGYDEKNQLLFKSPALNHTEAKSRYCWRRLIIQN